MGELFVQVIFALLIAGKSKRVTADETELLVKSSFGNVIGIASDAVRFGNGSKPGARFLGIPYAKPPTGDRRFKRPEPETMLKSPHNATYFRQACPQQKTNNDLINFFKTNEDCLYLNLFVPGSQISSNNTFPVMIWIYGGGFRTGVADIYYGDVLSSFNDVIVVTFNYRVHVLGFLDDGTGSYANNGLYDQKLVIDWVQNHIQSFGGDPSRVTLIGESVGGASVMYQALHPGNRGKIHRIIAQSGSVLARWAFEENQVKKYNDYIRRLNCSSDMTNDVIACLRDKPVDEINDMLDSFDVFKPTIDGELLTMNPSTLFMNYSSNTSESLRAFAEIDCIIGFNNKDGAINFESEWNVTMAERGIDIAKGVPKSFFESVFVPPMLDYMFGIGTNNKLIQSTIHEYIDWNEPENNVKVREGMVDFSTDITFLVPAVVAARKHDTISTTMKTFMYQFSHRPILLPPAWLDGASHTWDIGYTFGLTPNILIAGGLPNEAIKLLPVADIVLANVMMQYWTNFAKNGNPNSNSLKEAGFPTWPVYSTESEAYVDLTTNLTSDSIKRHPAAARVDFWTRLVPLLIKDCESKVCHKCKRETSSAFIVHSHWTRLQTYILFVCVLLTKLCN